MLLEKLADYAIHEQTSRLPDEVWHHAKRCVIDWTACLLPGMVNAPATVLIEALADELDHGRATLPVYGRKSATRAAAMIMGAASHTVEFDDIYRAGGYHPGSPTISAALAAAQAVDASGEDFLRGVIVGYEISTRICEAVMPSHYVYWHTPPPSAASARPRRRRPCSSATASSSCTRSPMSPPTWPGCSRHSAPSR